MTNQNDALFAIRSLDPIDRAWVADFIRQHWGAEIVVAHGVVYHPHELPGLVAAHSGVICGLVTYHIDGNACEIVSIDSTQPGIGIGTALIDAVKERARCAGCQRLFLITTNDNVDALRFYQKRGFVLVTVHRNALEESRKLKSQIPLIGAHGILLRDEIEMEMVL